MPEHLIVVGGGAGGPSAAAKAKRLNPELAVTIVQSGRHVSFAA
jgi:NADH dehydrogenase FAD-containing subunit